MKNRTLFFTPIALGLALAVMPLEGCGYLKARQARHAYAEYQDALAAGDMNRARAALVALVRSDQDVSDYWIELGKLQIQLGDYREAYDAFSHAHELDRSNIGVLASLTQLALLSGDVDLADSQARSLALVAPNNPVVTLVRGYVAYKSGELDKGEKAADELLVSSPNDPFARMLKARVLIKDNRVDEAIAVLEEQHRTVPTDGFAVRGLTGIYRVRADWKNLARIQVDAHNLAPKNTAVSQGAVEALLRAGDVQTAGRISGPLLAADAPQQVADATLNLWARYAPAGTTLPNGKALANAATGERRVSFAHYYNDIGDAREAAMLLSGSQLPVSHANARRNAVYAQSLALMGSLADAKKLFDLVLAKEPDQVESLRGRSVLEARTGDTKQAIIDAQRLVTMSPDSGPDRLILARAFLADRNGKAVRRTLWEAFQDIPDDERIFAALTSVLASTGDIEGQSRLRDELADRRSAQLTKEVI